MERRDAFVTLWNENFSGEDLPDLQFLDTAEEEALHDKVDLCKKNLKESLGIVKREAFILRYLCEILNISDMQDFKNELYESLKCVFANSLEISKGLTVKRDHVIKDQDRDIEKYTENKLNVEQQEEEPFRDRGDTFGFVIESRIKRESIPKKTVFGNENESGPASSGSDLGPSNVNPTAETSATCDVELLSKQNIKVVGRESLVCDGISTDDNNESLANQHGQDISESNEEALMRVMADGDSEQMDAMEGNAGESQSAGVALTASELEKDFNNTNKRQLSAICDPFSASLGITNRIKPKWHVEEKFKGDLPQMQGNPSAPDRDAELTSYGESKSSESQRVSEGNGTEISNETGKLKIDHDMATSEEGNVDLVQSNSSDIIEKNLDERKCDSDLEVEGRPSLAEEETCFDLTEGKDTLDTPDVSAQGTVIVDDLISFLESIQLENSSGDEEDSLLENNGDAHFGIKDRPHAISRKQQLQSELSSCSVLSGDSCLSPWALDLAMAEIHSADSSDQEDTPPDTYNKSPAKTNKPTIKLPGGNQVGLEGGSPPPIRPPRRRSKKGMMRAHTVDTPKRVRPTIRTCSEDDDVFSKEEEGYEGDQEGLSLNLKEQIGIDNGSGVRFRAQSDALNDERRKLRRSRGSNVILDEDNIDFPSSPLSSPGNSPRRIPSNQMKNDDAHKLHTRKWVASAVMDSEKGYVECLSMLYKYMRPITASLRTSVPILTVADFNKIFFKVEELFHLHSKFYIDLESRVANWNLRQIIGDLFLSLVSQFDIYREYILNYKTAMDTIRKCRSNEQFDLIFKQEIKLNSLQEVSTVEGLFSKPVDRIGRYVTVLNDLLKQTPMDHPDYSLLVEVQTYTQEFLLKLSGGDQKDGAHVPRVKRDHRLLKDGFLVELADGVRKFRHIFLFNDVLICAKRKISGRHEQYVCKWYSQLADIQFFPHENSEAAQIVPVASKADFDLLKGRIVGLKAEIRKEQGTTGQGSSPDASPATKRKRAQSNSKVVEKLKKKLAQQEAALLLTIPSLPLHLYHKQGKTYTVLSKSDVERADWKEAVIPLLKQDNLPCGQLSIFELQTLLEACKKLRTCKTLGKVSIKEDKELLNGLLYVHIQNGKGFHRNDLYCMLEVDHYGQFVKKAKTKICKAAGDPVWDQDFDVEVEGTKDLRIHVYGKSRYGLRGEEECGMGRVELTRENLVDQKKRTITITLDKPGAITFSIQYSKTLQGIQRKKSMSSSGVFGVDISKVTSRESCDIPLIIIGCVREIEKRGLDEVGVYRLSGASTDVRRLREAFDENSQSALVLVSEADIHAVAGLLKMYVRDLPEPLFTDALYNKFVEANGLSDAEDKKERMIELFQSLPAPNRLTATYLFEHLRKLGEQSEVNKMGLNNLATVFGPNVLRPSPTTSSPMDLAQGTLDVMSQVGIFLYFLKMDSDVTRLPNDPELMRRLDPSKGTVEQSESPDRLI